MRWVISLDMQEKLEVRDDGLYLKKERSQALIPWEQVQGFTGVLRHRPGPLAPRMTTGGLSGSLVLRCGKRAVSFVYAGGEGLEAAVTLIEQRLLAREGQGGR
jgi:hypothetical protein